MRDMALFRLGAAFGYLVIAVPALAQSATGAKVPLPATLRSLSLTQGGVGVFGYAQDVDGAAVLTLPVPARAVADALRSARVLDPAGPAREITVPTGDPALVLTQPGDGWLDALVGATVTVVTAGPDATPIRGRVVRTERTPASPTRPTLTRLTLLTEQGLRQTVLESAVEVRLDDPALRARIAEGAAQATRDGREPTRAVDVALADGQRRTVAIDLVLPVPLWKPTWRLTLPGPDAGDAGRARLQGWAVVENTSGSDWHDVRLSLVAGNPVTLDHDVYAVVDVTRPVAEVAGPARLAPDADTRAAPASVAPMAAKMAMPPPAPTPMMARPSVAEPSSPAEVSEVAESSIFALARTLDLATGHTAGVPFLDAMVPARLVDSLEPDAPHPIAAARLENNTGHALPAGVVSTSAPGTAFAGDAKLGNFPAGQTRLLAFAEDGAVDATWRSDDDDTLAAISAAGGILKTTRRQRDTTTVALTGAADGPRSVLVAVPREADQELSADSPKPLELTDTRWRFLVALKAGERRTLVVTAERRAVETLTLIDADTPTLLALADTAGLPASARAAVQRLVDLRGAVAAAQDRRTALAAERTRLTEDEERSRRNLMAVPASDPLHTRLVATLAGSEERLAALARELDAADVAVRAAQTQLRVATNSVTL